MIREASKPQGIGFVLSAFAMGLCTFMEVLDLTITNVAIPYISGDLAVSSSRGVWVITTFMVGNAIVMPISGWLADKIGSIRLILISSIFFGIVSFLCGIALNFPMLVFCRFLQGVVAGPLIPMSQILLIRIFPKGKENMAIALWAMVLLVGPILGPIVGGWITENYSWRWIFFINIPIALFSFFTLLNFLKKEITPITSKKLDLWGLLLLCVGITCLQIALDQGRQLDWFQSPMIRTLFIVSFVSLTLLVVYEWNLKEPLVEMRLVKNIPFTIGTLIYGIAFTIFYATVVITPLWLEDYMGYTSLKAGICLGTTGIAPFLFAPLVGKLMGKGYYKRMLAISFLLMALAAYYYSTFNTQVSLGQLALSRFLFGLGLVLYIAPSVALPLVKIPQNQQAAAASITQFFRMFLAGAGTSIYTSLWNNRATFHHERIGSTLTPFNDSLTHLRSQLIEKLGFSLSQYYVLLNEWLDHQAYMLATNDVMLLTAISLLIVLILLFFVRVTPQECRSGSKRADPS